MPTISVKRDELFLKIGQKYSDDEFDEICFQFGIEIDEIVEEPCDDSTSCVVYKIEVGANRYDLLCVEGLAQALRIFLDKSKYPIYKFVHGASDFIMEVDPKVSSIRPYVGTAILRDVTITPDIFKSLIDLQEKLHHNICRKRKLVAIGVHDLDTIRLPLKYTAASPSNIKFMPLTIDEELDANEMFSRFEKNHLKEYLPIIKDFSNYPIIVDSNNTILSLPPIINGQHTQVKFSTKNILIECTGTDRRRTEIVLLTICTMLSEHCANKYTIECGKVVSFDCEKGFYTPNYEPRQEIVCTDYLNRTIGIKCSREEYVNFLERMSLLPVKSVTKETEIIVTIPPTRQDILHACDIMEDAAIAYGFNNIEKKYPKICTIGSEQYVNRLGDKLRQVAVRGGFNEALSFIVCSMDDLSKKMHNLVIREKVVQIASNTELNAVRINLLSGLLKTLTNNKKLALPIKIFEVGDVVFKVSTEHSAVGAINEKRMCALYCGKNSGFEIIKGLLDKIMAYLGISFGKKSSNRYFYLNHSEEQPSMFPGRNAKIMLMEQSIGTIGMIHPNILKEFDITHPCSAFEFCVEKLIDFASL